MLEQEAFALGYQAYIWGYPYVKTLLLKNEATHPQSRNYAPVNQFRYYDELAKPGFHDFTPTVEALMNVGWMDLSQGPIVLDVPQVADRYWSVVANDAGGSTTSYLGSRLDSAAGRYAYVLRGWQGTLPEGVTRIDLDSRFALLMVRVLVRPSVPGDVETAVQQKRQFRLAPLNTQAVYAEHSSALPASAKPMSPVFHSLDFFDTLNAALDNIGLLPGEAAVAAQFATLGIGPGHNFAPQQLSEAQQRGLLQGMQAAFKRMGLHIQTSAQRLGVWNCNYKVGIYGYDFLMRATVALAGYGAMVPEETLYINTAVDTSSSPLDGACRYTLRFEVGQYPPVDAFWSITLYSKPDNQLVANAIDRYSISSETIGLRHATDGSLTIPVQVDAPVGDAAANWLPAPHGPFWLVLRTYVPHAPLLQGKYTPPDVVRID
jgi:hypothetical protein